MEELLFFFNFSLEQIIFLSLFFIITLIQLFYYLYFYRKPVSYYKKKNLTVRDGLGKNPPSVSVIVLSRNESENLRKNLPFILNQDYPNFEVIVVNDGSTDESHDLLEALSLEYSNLYHTFIQEPADRALPRKMLSMTIGIKAAKNDMLLFIEPDCVPVGNKWISSMMLEVEESTKIVIGYSYYERAFKFFRRMARFDNLLFSLRYISLALRNKGFIGIYRNIAFRRHLFFDTNGLSSCLNSTEGDTVYLNKIIKMYEYKVALHPESFVSLSLDYWRWCEIKRIYMRARKFFTGRDSSAFRLETISMYLLYLLAIAGVILGIHFQLWGGLGIIMVLFILRQITQFIVLKKASLHFRTNRFLFSLPLMDVLQPLYNLYFSLTSRLRSRYSN